MPDTISQRNYTDPAKQYAARIAGYDQRLTVLERLGGGGGGSGGSGAAYADVQSTPPDPNNPTIAPPEGLLWIDTSVNVNTQYAKGLVAVATGPSVQTDVGSSGLAIVQVAAALTAGRIYKVSGQALGSQQTTTGTPQAYLNDTAAITGNAISRLFLVPNLAAAIAATGHAMWIFTAASNQTVTFNIWCWTTAGVFRFGPNTAQIAVEDIGGS